MTREIAAGAMPSNYWSKNGGQAWVEQQELVDRLYQMIGEAVEEQVFPEPGGRVLDVGCGGGATTLAMARRLAPRGICVGVDVSAELLELARRRAAGVGQAQFVQADAETHDFGDAVFDAVMSRFGVMFFTDPIAAFANLRRAVRPGGKLAFASWRSPAENPLSQAPLEAAAPFVTDLPRPPPDAPGRFAFADPDRVRRILAASGWRDIEIVELDVPTPLSFDELLTLSLRLGPLAQALPQQPAEVRAAVEAAVAARLEPHVRDGVVPMTAACWLVTARNPAGPAVG